MRLYAHTSYIRGETGSIQSVTEMLFRMLFYYLKKSQFIFNVVGLLWKDYV